MQQEGQTMERVVMKLFFLQGRLEIGRAIGGDLSDQFPIADLLRGLAAWTAGFEFSRRVACRLLI